MEPMEPMAPIDGDAGAQWWPEGLSHPDSSGSQGRLRYAFFAGRQRLVVDDGGTITQYDTGDRRITGVAQQQDGRSASMPTFSTAAGDVTLDSLRAVG